MYIIAQHVPLNSRIQKAIIPDAAGPGRGAPRCIQHPFIDYQPDRDRCSVCMHSFCSSFVSLITTHTIVLLQTAAKCKRPLTALP